MKKSKIAIHTVTTILVLFIPLISQAQFTSAPIDSGEFYVRSFSYEEKGEKTTGCHKLPLKYYFTEKEVGIDCLGEFVLHLTWFDFGDGRNCWAVDSDGTRWLVHFEVGREGTNQIYHQVTPDAKSYYDGPHFQVSSKDVCPESP